MSTAGGTIRNPYFGRQPRRRQNIFYQDEEPDVQEGNTWSRMSTTSKIILVVLMLCGLTVIAYTIYFATHRKTWKMTDEESSAKAAQEMIKIRQDQLEERRARYEAQKLANAAERRRLANIIFGFDGPLSLIADSGTTPSVLINDYGANLDQMASQMGLAAGDAPPPGGNLTPAQVDRITMQTIATALCPSQMYYLWSSDIEQIWACLQKCPVGYESITYAPRDEAGNPLMVHPIDPVTGKEDLTKLERVPPTPWCRALCPILLASPKTQNPYYSEHLTADVRPVVYNGKQTYTDDSDPAYCKRKKEQRRIMSGGNDIVCGWCEKDLPVSKDLNGTSVNRHHCETSGNHYGLDFTDWCQRRRMIPNFRIEKIDDKNDGKLNNLQTAICAGIGGVLGGAKKMHWIEGPKACRGDGELIPINSSGYFDGNGNAVGMVAPTNLFYGSRIYKIPDDKIIARFADKEADKENQKDYSLMHYACYSACPPNMTPVGPVENHLCAESCPPNTSSLLTFSDDIRCKKMAYQQPIAIEDFMMVVSEMAKAYQYSLNKQIAQT